MEFTNFKMEVSFCSIKKSVFKFTMQASHVFNCISLIILGLIPFKHTLHLRKACKKITENRDSKENIIFIPGMLLKYYFLSLPFLVGI